MIKYNPKAVLAPPQTILKKIETEIEKENYLAALFLEASAIEGYLSSLILLSKIKKQEPRINSQQFVEKMSFIALVSVNNVLGNIDDKQYENLTKFNAARNDFAHYLIGIDFNDSSVNTETKNLTQNGLVLCKELATIHEARLKAQIPST